MIPVHEIAHTLIGEGLETGMRCLLVRTFGCNLKCSWCDTNQDGVTPKNLSVSEIVNILEKVDAPYVLITGGEPLLHEETSHLCSEILKREKKVIIETNGTLDVSLLPVEVKKIMDLKPPSSGHEGRSLLENIRFLDRKDEIKIVIASNEDYIWAKEIIKKELLNFSGIISLSPVLNGSLPKMVAKWIIEDKLYVRLNLQIHKMVFPEGENVIF